MHSQTVGSAGTVFLHVACPGNHRARWIYLQQGRRSDPGVTLTCALQQLPHKVMWQFKSSRHHMWTAGLNTHPPQKPMRAVLASRNRKRAGVCEESSPHEVVLLLCLYSLCNHISSAEEEACGCKIALFSRAGESIVSIIGYLWSTSWS
jgi:hypothetical protein